MVVWGKVVVTDTAVPRRCLEVKGLSPMGKTLYIKPTSKANEVNPFTSVHWVADEEDATARIVYRPTTGIFPKSARAFSLPVLVNKKYLQVGQEITLKQNWEPDTIAPIKRHVAATVESSEKPRTGNVNID